MSEGKDGGSGCSSAPSTRPESSTVDTEGALGRIDLLTDRMRTVLAIAKMDRPTAVMYRVRYALAMLAALVMITIGAMVSYTPPSDSDVEKLGMEYFTALKAKDFERALDYYGPDYFQAHPRAEWKAHLQEIQQKLGDMQSFELKLKQVDLRSDGKYFIHEYSVVYANGKSWETVTFIHVNDEQPAEVFGHTIKAKEI